MNIRGTIIRGTGTGITLRPIIEEDSVMPESHSLSLMRGTLDVLVLKTVSWGPLHGYAISRYIREQTGEVLSVEEGALYPALRRMEKKFWLTSYWGVTQSGREAKFYELTEEGRKHLKSEIQGWQRYVEAMSQVLTAQKPAFS